MKKLKIPDKLMIAGKEVTIKRDDKYLSSEVLVGQNRSDEDVIYIPTSNTHFSSQCIEQTLIHEIIHKINNILCTAEENRENYVNPLSELLYQVIKQL